MFDVFKELYKQKIKNYANKVLSDIKDCYIIYRNIDDSIVLSEVNMIRFDMQNSYEHIHTQRLQCDIDISTVYSYNDIVDECKALFNEFVSIKIYEDKLNELTDKINKTVQEKDKLTQERNTYQSKYLYERSINNIVEQQKQICNCRELNLEFVMLVDPYINNHSLIMVIPLYNSSKFYETEYFNALFEISNNSYYYVNKFDDTFILCSSKNYDKGLNYLVNKLNKNVNIVLADESYLYSVLNR